MTKIACVQFQPILSDIKTNIAKMAAACPPDADIVIFPELATTGYLFAGPEDVFKVAEESDGPTSSLFSRIAKQNKQYICYGFAERAGDSLYNSSILIGPDGIIDVYRKVHLFDREQTLFSPGMKPWRVVDIGDARVGMMICYDWVVPEAMRSMALDGVDFVLHPSNLVLPWCQQAMKTRCLENGVFAATCNRVGEESVGDISLTFTGGSQITGPKGDILATAEEVRPQTISVDVDLQVARNKQFTPSNHLFEQRLPHLYDRLTRK